MNPENFCYWLQGYFELSRSNNLTEQQIEEIKNHLQLVFNKITPVLNYSEISYGQAELTTTDALSWC